MFVSPIGGVFLRYYNPTTTYCSWIRGLSRFSYSKVKTYEYFPFYNLIFIAVEVRLLRQFSSFTLLMVDERVSPICCSFMIWFSNDRFGCVIWTTCLVFCDRNGFSNYSNLMDIYSRLVTLQFFSSIEAKLMCLQTHVERGPTYIHKNKCWISFNLINFIFFINYISSYLRFFKPKRWQILTHINHKIYIF